MYLFSQLTIYYVTILTPGGGCLLTMNRGPKTIHSLKKGAFSHISVIVRDAIDVELT